MKKLHLYFTVFVLALISNVWAQYNPVVVTGTVRDDQGGLLPGATVAVKGTSKGVTTNANGAYTIGPVASNDVLVFSFIGFVPKEEKVGTRTVIDVNLAPDVQSLEEVVVVGYGTMKCASVVSACAIAPQGTPTRHREAKAIAPSYSQREEYNTEGYSKINENGFREVGKEPLSTFSVDVDRASYANVRRFLNGGQLPPADAVRIEEMVNYFGYDYPQPKGDYPFSVNTEMAVCPWNAEHYVLKVGLKGKEIDKSQLSPSNLVFLIDVSGSMDMPNKLPLLKSAFAMLVNQLRANDRVAIVVYAGAAGLVLPSTPGSQKQQILKAIDRLNAGGSTAGGAGLKLAYAVAKDNFIKGGNNRIVLATDGDFNVGVSSNAEMERLVEAEREHGVFMTVLGFGMGNYKDDKMEIIADKGNGNYAYIDNLQEAEKTLVREFGGTLFTIAKDVKLQLEFNPSRVAAYRLIGYENRLLANEDFNNDKKDAGDIGAGHTVTALYELVPVGAKDAKKFTGKVDPLKYQKANATGDGEFAHEWLTLKLRYKQPDGHQSKLLVTAVKGEVPEFKKCSADLQFACGVASLGMLLRNSEFKNGLTYPQAIDMIRSGKGSDDEGDRGELLKLAKLAASLSGATHKDEDMGWLVE